MSQPLVKEVRIACSPEHAFLVFTQKVDLWWPVGHRRFEHSKMTFEPRQGGLFFELNPQNERVEFGRVLHWQPPERLIYSWNPGAIKEPTQVEVTFVKDPNGTLVRVVHSIAKSGLGDLWNDRVALFKKGWRSVLTSFALEAQASWKKP